MKTVLLHGLGQSASSWEKTKEAMENGAEVACPQLFKLIGDQEVNYFNLYQAFCEYCDAFSEPLNLGGLSLGGILVMQYGIEHPDRVHSMALMGTQYVMPKGLLKLQNFFFYLMPKKTFQSMGCNKKDSINLSKSMMDLDFQEKLSGISCPVLVICGEQDNANRQAALQMKEQIPGAELAFIENAGHEVNVDAPKKLGTLLEDFWKKQLACDGNWGSE